MLKKFVIFACTIVVCLAAGPQGVTPLPSPTPTPAQSQVYCGETPNNIISCLGNPAVIKPETASKCKKSLSECDRTKCIFREAGWSTKSNIKDDAVNKITVAEYFKQYAVEHPEWSNAVQHLKVACLDKDLPAQGTAQNCAAYDVLHCIQTSFLRNAPPSLWRNTADCAYPRSFAAACPLCPSSCFAPQANTTISTHEYAKPSEEPPPHRAGLC